MHKSNLALNHKRYTCSFERTVWIFGGGLSRETIENDFVSNTSLWINSVTDGKEIAKVLKSKEVVVKEKSFSILRVKDSLWQQPLVVLQQLSGVEFTLIDLRDVPQ